MIIGLECIVFFAIDYLALTEVQLGIEFDL